MEMKPSYWRRINPLFFIGLLALIAEVTVYQVFGYTPFFALTGLATAVTGTALLFALKNYLDRIGRRAPGKKFVAEVVIVHWRGETSRFWGIYRYEWVANFTAQFMAYMLDHLGNVHWEFGISFRVHDEIKRAAAEAASNQDPDTPQPA
jgi:hypothetical protein